MNFLDHLDATLVERPCVSIHIVLDNYATYKRSSVKRWLVRHPVYRQDFNPTSSSRLNQIERFFAEITENRIHRGAFRSVLALIKAINEYISVHNMAAKPSTESWTPMPTSMASSGSSRFVNGVPNQDTRTQRSL